MIRHSDQKKRYLFISTAVIAVTFIVRVWGLTETSLWYDEVFVLTYAQQGPLHAVMGLLKEDNALPLHGLLTALWLFLPAMVSFPHAIYPSCWEL